MKNLLGATARPIDGAPFLIVLSHIPNQISSTFSPGFSGPFLRAFLRAFLRKIKSKKRLT
jgi:hypothetical protein